MPPLSVQEIEEAVHSIAKEMMDMVDEPIPPFGSRYRGSLEGAISAPFQSYGGQEAYPEICQKAAALFYFMIKDHPFENGNKRIAVVALLYYLAKNNLALNVTPSDLYSLAVRVADTPSGIKDQAIEALTRVLEEYNRPLPEWLEEVGREIQQSEEISNEN